MITWSGCWEDRGDRKICRYMIAWQSVGNNVAGCLGGYSGGGAFQMEKFIQQDAKIYIESEINIEKSFDASLISALEDCQDKIYFFHDQEKWFDSENLILDPGRAVGLDECGDMLMGGETVPSALEVLFTRVGLITSRRKRRDEA